jgi:DNA polymerase-4
LLGVGASGLRRVDESQLSLFEEPSDRRRRRRLNRALDQIRERFGGSAVARASQGSAERAGLSMQIKRGDRLED